MKNLIALALITMLSLSLVSGYAFIRDDGSINKNDGAIGDNKIQSAPIIENTPKPTPGTGNNGGGGGGSSRQGPTQAQLQECYNRTFDLVKPSLYQIFANEQASEMNNVFTVVYSKENQICSNKVMSVIRGLFRDLI